MLSERSGSGPLAQIAAPQVQRSVSSQNAHRPPPTLDEEYLELEDSIPGFAGLYYDEGGTAVLNLVDLRHGVVAERVASRFLRGRSLTAPGMHRLKQVEHVTAR